MRKFIYTPVLDPRKTHRLRREYEDLAALRRDIKRLLRAEIAVMRMPTEELEQESHEVYPMLDYVDSQEASLMLYGCKAGELKRQTLYHIRACLWTYGMKYQRLIGDFALTKSGRHKANTAANAYGELLKKIGRPVSVNTSPAPAAR